MRTGKHSKSRYCDWPMHDIWQGHESGVTCPQCNNQLPKTVRIATTIISRVAQCIAYAVAFFATFIFGGICGE